ncbi:hypothetical protein [Halorubrum sp. HHNYT27]|uniref:hypothetical protein n=1 Tax=Halorubrum sp. HHNYT27 TaxID=3402275 RepID=UPI003EBB4492
MGDSVEPHVIRLREDAAGWREVDGPRLTPDEPFLTGLSAERAESLVGSNWALRPSDVDEATAYRQGAETPPFDPGEYTIDELTAALADAEYDAAALDALYDAEADGKDRTGALDVIDAARGKE